MRQLLNGALCGIGLLAFSCKTLPPAPTGLVAEHGMVVSARKEASAIGAAILKRGGNAFDAMVATELALAVAYPFAGNLGGGGFMVYRMNDGTVGALDYREKAPASAHRDMYLDSLGNVSEEMSTRGATAVGVPGTVAGIFAVQERFGSLPMEDLIDPVLELLAKGIPVTARQAARFDRYRDDILEVTGESTWFFNQCRAGDTIWYPALSGTLRQLRDHGRDEFYKGRIAKKLAAFIQARGGFVSEADLSTYEARWREPVIFEFDDLKIISMSPPSSGGVTMNQMFHMMAPYNPGRYEHNSLEYIQLFTEAARRAYADRNYYLGDPDFVKIPLRTLLSNPYLRKRMEDFSFDRATPSAHVGHGKVRISESMETTHYSIVDQFGNAVAVTTTLNGAYGSKLYCDELGFFLNNEMDDFSAKAGVPNMFGLTGAEANSISPGKRMLSSMTPTIVEKDGALWLVVGTPGGSTIITAVAQTILNVHAFGMSMQEAVSAPRFHHQWLPDQVIFEPGGFSQRLIEDLKGKGYQIDESHTPIMGKVDAIRVLEDGRLEGGADPRGDDTAVGF